MKRKSIRRRMMAAFIGVTLAAMVLVTAALLLLVRVQMQQLVFDNTLQIVRQIANNVDQNLDHMSSIAILTMHDQLVIDFFFMSPQITEREKLDNTYSMYTQLGNLLGFSEIVTQIHIYNVYNQMRVDVDKRNYFRPSKFNEEFWYSRILRENKHKFIFFDKDNAGYPYYYVAQKISETTYGGIQGFVIVASPVETIRQMTGSYDFGQGWCLFITDQDDTLVFSTMNQENEAYISQAKSNNATVMVEGKKFLVVRNRLETVDWHVTCFIPTEYINRDIYNLTAIVMGIALVSLLAVVIIVNLLVRTISNPIIALSGKMRRVKEGDFSVRVPVAVQDEIGVLSEVFNEMAERIDELIKTNYLANLRQKEAAIKSLQAQINPHFLYNTMESIRTLAVLNDDYDTARMIATLGSYLRFKLHGGSRWISLAEELENVRNYIAIMQMKYEWTIHLHTDIDTNLPRCRIIKLILQPIVENAILHGFNEHEGDGFIWIQAKLDEGNLIIEVQDNGCGMDEQRLLEIRGILQAQGTDDGENIGLKNVHDRIRLEFGELFGLMIGSAPQNGTTVRLILPALAETEEEHV
jgi:two-component system sensor histidine kinase YesM